MANGNHHLNASERNAQARRFVTAWLSKAQKFQPKSNHETVFAKELAILKKLIPISAMGFRGVVLTVIVGKHLDPTFNPLKNFYDCSPRSIFEKGIYYALQDAKIPCGKSDPLNVAKNIQVLDDNWATGRKPESAARAAVEYLRTLESAYNAPKKYNRLILLFFHELLEYGKFVNAHNAPATDSSVPIPLQQAKLLANFSVECPEGGTIPQYIVGQLISHFREHDDRIKSICGFEESVFGTNTTAKKPADVWEVLTSSELGNLYEITVKIIDYKRLDDCIDSLRQQNIASRTITFICNLPQDIAALGLKENFLSYNGIGFQFLDIRQFICAMYCMLSVEQQKKLMESIQTFIFDHNRPIKTKKYWQKHFA